MSRTALIRINALTPHSTKRTTMLDRALILVAAAMAVTLTMSSARAFDETKYPDWAGIWVKVPDGGPPRYDPSKPIRKQEAPLKPEYQSMYDASLKDIDGGGFGLDRHYACFPMGMPRQMAGIAAMEFVITPGATRVIYDDSTALPRRIFTDGRGWPKEPELNFAGYSLGKWIDSDGDGRFDTLEIETRYVKGPRTFDQTGLPMADDNGAVFKERLFLDKTNPSILHDEITTIDSSLTRPWTAMKSYRRKSDEEWVELNCGESNNYVTIDGQVYYIGGDGLLVPMKKGQPAPDLKYFK
jgi:hypothetical protein